MRRGVIHAKMPVTKNGTATVRTMPEKMPRMVLRSPEVRMIAGRQVSLAAPAAESGPSPPKTRAMSGANSRVTSSRTMLAMSAIEPRLTSASWLMSMLERL